jgi:hypothetical protein
MRSDNLLSRINKLNVSDGMVRKVLGAIGSCQDEADESILQASENKYFDTCSLEMLERYELEAGLSSKGLDEEARRSALEAKWKSSGKTDVEMLQAIARSWKNGNIDVDFVDNKIQITFCDELGLPKDRGSLEAALDEVKPAHLPISYDVRYLMISDVEGMSLAELETHTLSHFATK